MWQSFSTMLLTLGMLCSILVIRERGAAVRTGVAEQDIRHIKSIYPMLFLLPGLVVLTLGLKHLFLK